MSFHFSFVPVFTLVPILLGLWETSSWQEWNFSYAPLALGCVACLAVLCFVGYRIAGDAAINVFDNFLQLFFAPPSTGSFFTRDVFGFRRNENRNRNRTRDGHRASAPKEEEKRFDRVAEALQKMETCVYENRQALEALSISELKARSPQPPVQQRRSMRRQRQIMKEKCELIEEILQKNGTSNQMCVICYSDYENGDVQRKLPCGHRFHIECVDQWILQKSRCKPPVCPMCNQPVVKGLQ